MTSSPTTCAACGATGTGRFCASCGVTMGASACRGCGTALAPSSRFCPSCGEPAGSASRAAAGADRTPWILASVALVALLAVVLAMMTRSSPTQTAAAAEPGQVAGAVDGDGGTPPDISNMSPKERFDRLYNRVMRAAQSGDEATVSRFTPMALMAYAQLDTIDADARYHAALLEVHNGDVAGPTALADTILAKNPGHLFGFVIRGTVARWQKDQPSLAKAYAAFLQHYDAELKAARPEYAEHKTSIDEFHKAALQSKAVPPGT